MAKPVKYTVAVVIRKKDSPNEFLVVKRPAGDPDLQGHWGFPAGSLKPGELFEDVVARVCKERLNCEVKVTRFLGMMFQKRNSYDIFLMDMEAEVVGDKQPNVNEAKTTDTDYVEQKWSSDPMDLMPSAQAGSCCASIFLTDRGLLDRDEWVSSLEGSGIVG